MRPSSKIAALACVLTLGGLHSLGHLGNAGAQEANKPARSARGGALAKTTRHQFEVFFYNTGLRVFPLDSTGSPIDASRSTGTATFYHPNSPQPWFTRPIRGATSTPGQASPSLDLIIGLGGIPATGARVAFEIAGLSDPAEPTAAFTVPFEVANVPAESVAAQPAAPSNTVATSPPYVYGPGYYGYGYYQYAGPQAAPAQVSGPTVYSYGGSGQTHDRSTGRDLPSGGLLSKPWLRSMD